MYLAVQVLLLLYTIYPSDAGYGEPPPPPAPNDEYGQSDVQAPAYVPPYAKSYSGTKSGYGGTKSGRSGTKTGYSGTKTGYGGTKSRYSGTKSGYSGTKDGYSATKSNYGESNTWYSDNNAPPSYSQFQKNAQQSYKPICDQPCMNSGICVGTNTCHCPVNYYGKYCEFEKKPCLYQPPQPMNSERRCSPESCAVTCMAGHKFPDGSNVAYLQCTEGQWVPTRADFTTVPDCMPECTPACENGGVCLDVNTCQCPDAFRGPQCQYSTSACDVRKLGLNAAYKCFGDGESFSCVLSCPAGTKYSSPPADSYTCLYSTGVFQPQPLPQCIYPDIVEIPSSHYRYNRTYGHSESSSESHWSQETITGTHSHHETITGSSDMSSTYGSHGSGKYGTYGTKRPVTVVVQDFTPKGGTCLTWAGVHYKTFDGMIYSFQSPCQHVLVRDAKEHKYSVEVKHGDCKNKLQCPSELTVYLDDKFFVLAVGADGSVLFRNTKRLIPIPASLPGIRVSMPSDYVLVNLDALGATIKWDTNNLILVEASVLLWNKTEGLCGTLDGNSVNDLRTRDGAIAKTKSVLASAWKVNKIGDVCDSNPTETSACASLAGDDMKRAQQFCTKIFSKDKFRKCSKVMDVSLLLETCQWDYCACATSLSPEECGCSTVAVYAKECLRHGVEEMKTWRDDETCPMKCPENKVYKTCGPDVQPSCAFPQPPASSNITTCVEGCFCPEGLLLEEGRCIPKNECPCRLRNRNFKPGKTIKKDCNACTCQEGQWTCTKVVCGARCSAVGDPHYTTFDGLRYDFMGHCTYTMLNTTNLTVEVENVACSGAITEAMNLDRYVGKGKPSCTKAITLNYDGVSVHMKQDGFILVNGKEVSTLPVMAGDVRIRAASSLFVIVQLPNKVDLWWDGNTRVFIDVPAKFQGKTQGLCGTFNLNQKDDFLTPENDVEQNALAFANKWKTREVCTDIDTKEPEHPCKANMENKDAAEKYCSKLKSKVFEACHWDVDVEPFYEACVYDMCACAGDAARCLCPVLGDYAMTCAKAGVLVQWRYHVQECEISCAGGQEYTVCADSCLRRCSDMALATAGCKPCCVEGCACPAGQLLDDNGLCVPTALCPCYHKGLQFNAGYKEVRAGRRERELCTCVGALWDCKPATPMEIQNYPPAEDLKSNCTASNNMEFTTCQIAEPLTCKNMHLPPSLTTAECRPGCQCAKGYVLDMVSKKCVTPAQCPCHHGGRSYPDGHTMQEECNKCECNSGTWTCTKLKCAGLCSAWGDSHLVTFDGTDYDFEGVCTYLLAKGVMDRKDGFDVEIQNVPCGTTGATCSKSVTLKIGRGGNEEIVSLTKDAPIPDISKLKRIKMRIAGSYVFLDVPSLGMSLQWDRGMRVYVKVESIWQGRVKGLCGNYNGDMRDDFQTPSGGGLAESSVLIFADSWKLKPTCPKPQRTIDHCKQRPERKDWAASTCAAMKQFPFTRCHAEVPPAGYIERCTRDACACDAGGDCDCACAALAAYAHACAHRGVSFEWRTQDTCPMQCDEECSNYAACLPACPLETCDNTLFYAEMKLNCDQDTCVEGCKPKKSCPEGQVYKNSTHTDCVPRAKCKPVCMTLEDGREIEEGEIIDEDACHTCRCSKKTKVCTGQPCSTAAPITSPKPNDEPLGCVFGWTDWINRGPPEMSDLGESIDNEPLPKPKELLRMCEQKLMKKIECRTVGEHKTPKETGLDVECSLERGLVCREVGRKCLDFEIRVYCECEQPTPCENSVRPNEPHPTDCSKFYECAPEGTVLKDCGPGTMYSPVLMVCDWPASVAEVRPECGATTPAPETEAPSECPPGQKYSECAFRCDRVCHSFRNSLMARGRCAGEKCVEGCRNAKCDANSYWRDENTCVPMKDCTCDAEGKIVKPGGVVTDGCLKCQCLNNDLHCDATDCVQVSTGVPGSTHAPLIQPHILPSPGTTPATTPTTTTTTAPPSTAPPPPECSPDNYVDLLWGDQPLPESAFSASSIASKLYEPQYAKLNGHPLDITAGSWNPQTQDQKQYIQVEFPQPEAIYGLKVQGSPLFTQHVVSYEVLYGNDKDSLVPVFGVNGKPKIFAGPSDNNTPKKQIIEPPIKAKVIRIRPLTWHEEIAIRFEVIGCSERTTTVTTTTPTTTTSTTVTTPTTTSSTTITTPTTVRTTIAAPLIITSTVSPPPECEPSNYINLMWGDQPLPEASYSASSSASDFYEPQYAKLNGRPTSNSAGSWSPKIADQNQYMQVEFPRREPIYGVKMQGSPLFNQYVTSYEVLYGDDGVSFATVKGPDGKPKVFRGPVDHDTPLKQMIEPPIDALIVRIRPLTWHENIAVRLELIGCQELAETETSSIGSTTEGLQCEEPLGLAAGLPVEMIEVSSNNDARQFFALEGERGWRPLYSTPGEWIMFNFTSPRIITGIKTRGGPKGWVPTYKILYTSDLSTFNPVLDDWRDEKVFAGNFDKDSTVMNEFHPPIHAQYLKVLPISWKDSIEIRVEPIGCFEPYPTTAPVLYRTPQMRGPCELCPGVAGAGGEESAGAACACAEPARYYDGENCVTRDQCPCVESFMTYPVGSSFRGANCDECVCKLGGITDCTPVKECKCAPELVPKLAPSTCECLCEPCPSGTKICPTSKLCLPLEKWCDGLQDCPDDEKDCTTTPTSTVTTPRPTVTEVIVTTVHPTVAAVGTTPKPLVCPKAECPPGYSIVYTKTTPTTSHSTYGSGVSDLPPPRPRYSYQRFAKGGYSKGGFSNGGYSKGGYSKGGYSKGGYSKGGYGGYGLPPPSRPRQAFSLDKPEVSTTSHQHAPPVQECAQFKCIPKLPPFRPGGGVTPPPVCSVVSCPPGYSLKLDSAASMHNRCPQYECAPPPERQVFCNVTGRTFNTFDGSEYKYDACFHILARENRFDAWVILLRKKCRVDGCRNELLVLQDDQLILVKPNMMIEYDNYEYTVDQTSKICFQKNSFDVARLGNGIAIKSRKYNFTVLYSSEGDIKIGVFKKYMGSVDGLCGSFDGKPNNDRSLPDGRLTTSIDEFGRAWAKPGLPPNACRTRLIPEEHQRRAWELCDVITKEPLSQCGKVLNLNKWRSICLEKICECTELVVNGTHRSEQECRCLLVEQLVAECLAADKDIDVTPWRIQLDCPAECPPPLVHFDCYRKRCEPACSPYGAVTHACPVEDGQCFPGCYCPEGKLRRGDACIVPADCLDCTCNGVGTPAKFVTFEGDDLPFLGNCTYLASRDRNATGRHKYEVYSTNGPCEDNGVVCTQNVHLIYEKNIIHISKDPDTKKLLTTIGDTAVFKFPVKKDWGTISQVNGQDISIVLPDIHVELTVLQSKMEFTVRVPSYLYANQTEGLCGVCAGYQEHLITSNGTVTDDFEEYGKSWQATPKTLKDLGMSEQAQCDQAPPTPECVLPPPETNPCYNLLNADRFGQCHALVEPEPFVRACEADLCANATDACAALERYVAQCRRQGVCLAAWRADLCPWPCEEPLVYRPCVDCERTCENYDELKNPDMCIEQPVEGCFCPEGKVRVNNTCIEPTKCFPCDANKEHYAGDEWQEDACTKCTCSKLAKENTAHVSCTRQTCTAPVCAHTEDMITRSAAPGQCCAEYLCVPKPVANCTEPKKMDCGFGQVLKQKTTADGCTEFACECKPTSECEPIPSENEVDILEPGMNRVVDTSGCCPRVQFLCRVDTCPQPPQCDKYYELKTKNDSGKCCPEFKCELPKDKCIVKLEWEAASKGGEKIRTTPQVVLKDVEAVWLDGPCRSCRCEDTARGAAARCGLTECEPIVSSPQFVLEPRPVPFQCCPVPVYVACIDGTSIYRVGENWTSADNPCESYKCSRTEIGDALEKVTTLSTCSDECQPGWKYFPATKESGECCGKCEPVACVVDGKEKLIGEKWTSSDFCANYTCVNLNGTLQVQCSNETCQEVSDAVLKQFVLKTEKVDGKCCPIDVPVACRVGNKIYQVGQNWISADNPCESYKCSRTEIGGALEKVTTLSTCSDECQLGWKYFPATKESGECCGKCEPVACVVDGKEKLIGEKWTSSDFCANYTCVNLNGTLQVQCSNETCPELSDAVKKQFVLKTEKVDGKCCPIDVPVACHVGNKIYQEGQSWPSPDPCRRVTCARDAGGRLAYQEAVATCTRTCKRGWRYELPPNGTCCGRCVQDQCVVEDQLITPGTTWQSADNCTTFSCDKLGEEVYVTSARQACPDVSECAPENLVNETCCQVCEEPAQSLSKCAPRAIPSYETVGQVRLHLGPHGICVNKQPVLGLRDCEGSCDSGTKYNNLTASHDSKCECCQALQYDALLVPLSCEDGSLQPHKVASPSRCACAACGGGAPPSWKRPVYSGVKNPGYSGVKSPPGYSGISNADNDIPEIYQRSGKT